MEIRHCISDLARRVLDSLCCNAVGRLAEASEARCKPILDAFRDPKQDIRV